MLQLAGMLTFQDRVHGATVESVLHAADEKLLGSLGQIENDQLMVNRDRLHHLVDHLAVDLCAHAVDLRPVSLRDANEPHPIAVSHFAAECVGDFVVKSKTVSDLRKMNWSR
jgi:hypothetical protein